ncbi:PadR family transcriptional regulator [Halobaculum sp. P14]|uniref:PadR family transcriptional regulator n=1 Tax=Halobaculum sp. P14 TaxID=3421638 RepID=UPI003EBCF01E
MDTHDTRTPIDVSPREERLDPAPLTDMTGFKRNLLRGVARLDGERPHGLDLKAALEAHYDDAINHGRLYQNLGELVDAGLVDKRPVDGRTNAYSVTDDGRRALAAHHQWEAECLLAAGAEEAAGGTVGAANPPEETDE